MTNLETTLLEILTRGAIRFCSWAAQLFQALLTQMCTALYGTFISGFAKKGLTGPYWSYDNNTSLEGNL